MTIDKIKHYTGNQTYKYWTESVANNHNLSYDEKVSILKKARLTLERGLNDGILSGIKYEAELSLINHLLQ